MIDIPKLRSKIWLFLSQRYNDLLNRGLTAEQAIAANQWLFADYQFSFVHFLFDNQSLIADKFIDYQQSSDDLGKCYYNSLDYVHKYKDLDLAFGLAVEKESYEKFLNGEIFNINSTIHAFLVKDGNVADPTWRNSDSYFYVYRVIPKDVWQNFSYDPNDVNKDGGDVLDYAYAYIDTLREKYRSKHLMYWGTGERRKLPTLEQFLNESKEYNQSNLLDYFSNNLNSSVSSTTKNFILSAIKAGRYKFVDPQHNDAIKNNNSCFEISMIKGKELNCDIGYGIAIDGDYFKSVFERDEKINPTWCHVFNIVNGQIQDYKESYQNKSVLYIYDILPKNEWEHGDVTKLIRTVRNTVGTKM